MVEDSNNGYPPEWEDGIIQARISENAEYTCEICGLVFDPHTNSAQKADETVYGHVHHLNHFPPDCRDENLIFLCQNCHIRMHGLGWKPGDELPLSWYNEPPPWVLRRKLPYQLNPQATALQEAAKRSSNREERIQLVIDLIEKEGWISGLYDPVMEMKHFLQDVLNRYKTLQDERSKDARIPLIEEAAQWAKDQEYLDCSAASQYAGLHPVDFEAAVKQGFITSVDCPIKGDDIPAYYDPRCLPHDDTERTTLFDQLYVTEEQAAQLVNLSLSLFRRKAHQAGIKPIKHYDQQTGERQRIFQRKVIDLLRSPKRMKRHKQ